MADQTLTLAIMDAPYEAAASTTAFRIIAAALQKGINVNVFAYEGAVSLTMKDQAPHANPVKGTSVEEEDHPTTRDLVAALVDLGKSEPKLTWVNCGLCVDERGAGNWIDGVKRGGPADFLKMANESARTLVIPTK
jgi:tRNA 2-thiouridine synthesizing protein D